MPAPSTITASNINAELDKVSTSTLQMNAANTRNVATKSSGAISFGNCRWGINFPGGVFTDFGVFEQQYNLNDNLLLQVVYIFTADGVSQISAGTYITFFANGVMRLECTGPSQNFYHKTWLTSGVAGDYTVQFLKTSGTVTGAATNTDLAMSTDRSWTVATSTIGPGNQSESVQASGKIIIKDSGGTLIERPISMSADAEITF